MKYIFNLIPVPLLTIIVTAGCDTRDLHDLNIDPNSVNSIDMNYFFTAAELGSASLGSSGDNRTYDLFNNIGMCAHAIQQLAYTGISGVGSSGDKYIEDRDPFNDLFQVVYKNVAQNCAEILKQTGPGGFDAGNKVNMRNATRILRVLCYHRLTDWYGNIPYFEANKGTDRIIFPHYDKQKDIYADLLKELDEATKELVEKDPDDPDEGFKNADFIYNGDIDKWKRFGYALMLRLAMRISNVDAATAGTYVTKAVAGEVFLNNDDNVWVTMADGPNNFVNRNGISRAMMPGDGGQANLSHMARFMVNWLKGADSTTVVDDDPRLMIFCGGIGTWTETAFTPYPGGTDPLNQKGLQNGVDQSTLDAAFGHPVDIQTLYSKMNPKLLYYAAPYRIMTYSETELLQADAIERGIGTVPGTSKEHYENGVKAAMQMWVKYDPSFVVTDAQVATYLSQYPYGVTKSAPEMIGEQLWASHFMNWYEAWSDWRRTGFPKLIPVDYPGNDTKGHIPRKFFIPPGEAAGNPNYSTGATRPDDFTGKVWWDGGPE